MGITGVVSGSSVVLTVWNEGSEIPDTERALIFDRFYRGSKDRNKIEGTGLGLAIAKAIAEAHNGKIWLDAGPKGTAFRLQLPIEAGGTVAGRESDREQHYIAR